MQFSKSFICHLNEDDTNAHIILAHPVPGMLQYQQAFQEQYAIIVLMQSSRSFDETIKVLSLDAQGYF